MVKGMTYDCSNEHITKKLIEFAKKSNTNFSCFGNYVVTENQLDFKKFKFIPKSYYLKKIGEVKLNRWLNNDYDPNVNFNSKIIYCCFSLEKKKGNIYLYIKDKKYTLKSTVHTIPYFYKRLEKEFFEKDYTMSYTDESNIDDSINNCVEDVHDIITIEDEYDRHDTAEEYVSSYEKNNANVLDFKMAYDSNTFNFNIFYENYFKELTEIQQKITALRLLGIRDNDIAKLIDTSQPYINLTFHRLGKKLKKLYDKKRIKFVGVIEDDDINEEKII